MSIHSDATFWCVVNLDDDDIKKNKTKKTRVPKIVRIPTANQLHIQSMVVKRGATYSQFGGEFVRKFSKEDIFPLRVWRRPRRHAKGGCHLLWKEKSYKLFIAGCL